MQFQRHFVSLVRMGARPAIFAVMFLALLFGGVIANQQTLEAQGGITVVANVTDGTNAITGVPVYVFSGTTYTNQSATTDANGEATFSLPVGEYNFRADIASINGGAAYQYFSGTPSGINTCTVQVGGTIPATCNSTVTVPVFATVTVHVADSTSAATGLTVYAFNDSTYTNRNGVTNGSGDVAFNLPTGGYNFRADITPTSGGPAYQYFSGENGLGDTPVSFQPARAMG